MKMTRLKKMIGIRQNHSYHEKLWLQKKTMIFIMNINKHNVISS